MNRYHLAVLALIAIIAILLFSTLAHAASVPPIFDAPSVTVAENAGSAVLIINKSAKANSYSQIKVETVDGSAKAGVDYVAVNKTITIANNTTRTGVYIPIYDNATYQGSRAFTVRLTIVRFGQLISSYVPPTVTITDDEVAPTPTGTWIKCADENGTCVVSGTANVRYGAGTTWTTPRSVTSSIACNNATWGDPLPGVVKECDTGGQITAPTTQTCPDGTVIPATSICPPGPAGSWVSAPLVVSGYAFVKGSTKDGVCCNGLIVRLIEWSPSMWKAVFYADPSGNFPVGSVYETTTPFWYGHNDLQGVAPAP